MRWHLVRASALLRGRTELGSADYRNVLADCTPSDLVYMDPPYQGVCANRDPRYIASVRHADFVEALNDLNQRGVHFIVSYDGSLGGKDYGEPMPASLCLKHIQVHVGRSSQATLLGRGDDTCESLYLSPGLYEAGQDAIPSRISLREKQAALFVAQ